MVPPATKNTASEAIATRCPPSRRSPRPNASGPSAADARPCERVEAEIFRRALGRERVRRRGSGTGFAWTRRTSPSATVTAIAPSRSVHRSPSWRAPRPTASSATVGCGACAGTERPPSHPKKIVEGIATTCNSSARARISCTVHAVRLAERERREEQRGDEAVVHEVVSKQEPGHVAVVTPRAQGRRRCAGTDLRCRHSARRGRRASAAGRAAPADRAIARNRSGHQERPRRNSPRCRVPGLRA